MSSENVFEEDCSEEMIAELESEYVTESVKDEAVVANSTDSSNKSNDAEANMNTKMFQLPLTRIRNIMKLDPDLHVASNEAVFLVTRATELFIESLARESYSFTIEAEKKTIQKRDVDLAIEAVDSLLFLDGAMTF